MFAVVVAGCVFQGRTADDRDRCSHSDADQGSFFQTSMSKASTEDLIHGAQALDTRAKTIAAAEIREAGKAAQIVQSFAETSERLKSALQSSNSAMGYMSSAAASMQSAYQRVSAAEDAHEMQAADQEKLRMALTQAESQAKQLAASTAGNGAAELLEALEAADVSQASLAHSFSSEDRAMAGLSDSVRGAVSALTEANAKQTPLLLEGATLRLNVLQDAELDQVKQKTKLLNSMRHFTQDAATSLKAMGAKVAATEKRNLDLEAQLNAERHVSHVLLTTQSAPLEANKELGWRQLELAANQHATQKARKDALSEIQKLEKLLQTDDVLGSNVMGPVP